MMIMLIVVSQKIVAEVMSKGVLDVINIITDRVSGGRGYGLCPFY